MDDHNWCSAAGPPTRGNAVCGGPPHRGGLAAIRTLGGDVASHPVYTQALVHSCFPSGCFRRDGR
jgi:hypothetical protein